MNRSFSHFIMSPSSCEGMKGAILQNFFELSSKHTNNTVNVFHCKAL